jgi:predicted acyl esterase
MSKQESEVRDGMRIDWDVSVTMDDGVVVRADIFRPVAEGRYPAILTYGPYGKGLAFQQGYKTAWEILETEYADAVEGSTNLYQTWETPDPEKWVSNGYVCVRFDSRGAGRSEGFMNVHSARETKDLYDCIEWTAAQSWCSGKVGLNGISYFAANQWRVASLQPPHLAAICVWEGFADNYRDATHHGGILCTFRKNWQEMQVKTVQHGLGERGPRSVVTGELVCGPETLPEGVLAQNRSDMWGELLSETMDGEYYWSQAGVLDKIEVPLLSSGNWGGHGLHLRGNIEGYMNASSQQKWLEVHGGAHWAEFYTAYGLDLQRRFLGHFLKGENNGWQEQPKVQLQIRRPGQTKFVSRYEHEWPLARTQWTKFYLDPVTRELTQKPSQHTTKIDYDPMGEGVLFRTAAMVEEVEITGPSAVKLFLSAPTTDADVFLVLRVFDPKGEEVTFYGALDPHTPVGQGWLRASHRKLDPKRSEPYRPYHTHNERWPLQPNTQVELDIEVWPTSIVIPVGYSFGLQILGRDYEWEGAVATLSNMKNPMKGCGPFVHDDPEDRPQEVFSVTNSLHFSAKQQPHILLPIIPASK